MPTHITKKINCPNCLRTVDRATAPVDSELRQPEPGDISVCFYCANINKYDDDMNLRPITENELDLLEPETIHQLVVITGEINARIKAN